MDPTTKLLGVTTTTSSTGGAASERADSIPVPRRLKSLAHRFQALPLEEQQLVVGACQRHVLEHQHEYMALRQQRTSWYPTEPMNDPPTMQIPPAFDRNSKNSDQLGSAFLEGSANQVLLQKQTPSKPPTPPREYSIKIDGSWQHLKIAIAKGRFYIHLPTFIFRLVSLLFVWLFLALVVGDPMLPGGYLFDPIAAVIFAGVVGGTLSLVLHLPPLLGIFWAAILWGNIAGGRFAKNIHPDITTPSKAIGLTMILLRGGVSINLKVLRPLLRNVAVLALVPMLLEGCVNAFLIKHLFGLDSYVWAFLFSFTIVPLSSSVVVTSVLHLQSAGYGTYGGPTILMLSAVPFDSSLGIWAATFLQTICLTGNSSPLTIGMAPVQIIGGVLSGLILGVLCDFVIDLLYADKGDGTLSAEAGSERDRELLFAIRERSFVFVFGLAAVAMMTTRALEIEGGGSLCVVGIGAALSFRWDRQGEKGLERKREFSRAAATFWNIIAMPALFTFVGVTVDVTHVFSASFFPKALACVATSIACRAIGALVASTGSQFSCGETMVLCLGYVGKASAQATLGMMVYDKAKKLRDEASDPADIAKYDLYVERGLVIARLSVVMIMFAAPLSSIVIRVLGPKFVRPDL